MNHIYFVRHGVTQANLDHVFQLDSEPLSAEGVLQANNLTHKFSQVHIDKIYTSPMQRALDTAQNLSKTFNLQLNIDERIKEIDSASSIKGQSVYDPECVNLVQNIDQNFFSKSGKKISNEESYGDINIRALDFLQEISCQNKDIVVVTHHRLIAFLLSLMINYDPDHNLHCYFEHFFSLENTAVVHIVYDKDFVNRYTTKISPWKLISIH